MDNHYHFAGLARPLVYLEDNMTIVNRSKTLIFAALTLCAVSNVGYAQQWNGPSNETGTIWRPGNVAVGEKPQKGSDPEAILEVTRPLASSKDSDDLLFSANMLYKGDMSSRFQVDTRRAYAGGARSKAAILPPDLDFAWAAKRS
ncbi:MAG: hypothetical protein M3R15_09950 [Acidobacteriota bacterium]|nr:hypothetical protein [Acidobacteriota bacterium]